jgi:signal transduction histidine kinase
MGGKSSKPSFVWQGVLILLPVLLMAGFGTWAILHERKAVEQDARQRAQELLQSLPYNFSQRVASRMGMLAASDESLIPHTAADVAVSSETNKVVETWGAASNLLPGTFTNVLWTSLPGEVWPMNFLLATNGEVWDLTYQDAPQPPGWFGELTETQTTAWAELRAADLNRAPLREITNRCEAFLSTVPSAPARECAEFVRLRAQTTTQAGTEAVKALLVFGKNCTDAVTDSGVPLSNLVLAEALHRSAPGDANAGALCRQLQFEVCYRPSLLSRGLIEQAERVVGSDAAFTNLLHTLRGICETREVQRELAEQLKRVGVRIEVGTVTNIWIDAVDYRWLCVLQPKRVLSVPVVGESGSNQIFFVRTNVFTEVVPYPKAFLTKSFAESLKEARISVPDYFAVSMELEGEPIASPVIWYRGRRGIDAGELNALFEAAIKSGTNADMLRMLTGGPYRPQDVLSEQETALSLPASSNFWNGRRTFTRDYEAMPSHPRLAIRVLLADRALLYSRQRQRQVIFGALMAFSVAAALIGFMAARRAFVTQMRLSEAKSNFVSSVSHELRSPIASVRLMAESLERGKVAEGAKQNEYYRFIVQECRRLSALIENVLDFSRIEQGRKQYEFEPTDVLALTRETVKLMEPYAEEKGVQLTLEVPSSKFQVPNLELEVDGRAVQQALVNLIDNAIKHSAKGQTVTIGLDAERTTGVTPVSEIQKGTAEGAEERFNSETGRMPVLLWVEDHGPGIPSAEHEKIFERFYRLGSELRRETQGVGIGLSIVRHIVEAHGGKVTVRSNVGEGSRFTIVLPHKKAK